MGGVPPVIDVLQALMKATRTGFQVCGWWWTGRDQADGLQWPDTERDGCCEVLHVYVFFPIMVCPRILNVVPV